MWWVLGNRGWSGLSLTGDGFRACRPSDQGIQGCGPQTDTLLVDDDSILLQSLQNHPEVTEVFFRAAAGDEKVVDVRVAEVSPLSTWSINLWKVWAAFLSPKGILVNSKSPNGVVMAVLGMSSSSTGIWW